MKIHRRTAAFSSSLRAILSLCAAASVPNHRAQILKTTGQAR